MGKVSQRFKEDIEANFGFQGVVKPRSNNEPKPYYEGDIVDSVKRLLGLAETLSYHRDQTTQMQTLDNIRLQLNYIRFLTRNHRRRISDTSESKDEDEDQDWGFEDCRWEEPDEDLGEHPDAEHARDYYANQI